MSRRSACSNRTTRSLTRGCRNASAGELAQGKPVSIGADDPAQLALETMAEHKVRRLAVIDGYRLIGVVSQADLATNVDEESTGALVAAISAAD